MQPRARCLRTKGTGSGPPLAAIWVHWPAEHREAAEARAPRSKRATAHARGTAVGFGGCRQSESNGPLGQALQVATQCGAVGRRRPLNGLLQDVIECLVPLHGEPSTPAHSRFSDHLHSLAVVGQPACAPAPLRGSGEGVGLERRCGCPDPLVTSGSADSERDGKTSKAALQINILGLSARRSSMDQRACLL